MTQLSIKALRRYDEMGLLPAAHIDTTTGYRYYEAEQMQRAEVIRVLRAVDMPLEQIRDIVDAASKSVVSDALVQHRRSLERRLAEHQRMLVYVQAMLDREQIVIPYEIELKQVAPMHFAGIRKRTSTADIGNDISAGFKELMQGLSSVGAPPTGSPLILYHDVIDADSDGEIEVGVPVAEDWAGALIAPDTQATSIVARELPGGTAASTTHRGAYASVPLAYRSLIDWLVRRDMEVVGPTREIYLNDPMQVASEDLLTRLEFPVAAVPAVPE